jgi:adenosylhomocysteinase
MESKVKDPALAQKGGLSVEWAESRMPVLMRIREGFAANKPLAGVRVGASLHVTKETAVLVRTLRSGGAEVALCGSNPLSTQDDVAASLASEGVRVYAWRGQTADEYYWCIRKVIESKPTITIDDGADLTASFHEINPTYIGDVLGGTEETTTGVVRLRALAGSRRLKYPIISVNDAYTKYLFDNRYGTGQSTLDGILRSTSVLLAGKTLVVAGYGWCGRGIAMRARGMGAQVVVTEVDPVRALEALMDGFRVLPMSEAAEIGDIFVTATGDVNVIRKEHMLKMKNGAILGNAGHFNVEISLPDLESISIRKRNVRNNVEEYSLTDGRRLYLLSEGRLVNLAAAEGHPSEVMMMSFANQALCVRYIATHARELERTVHRVPLEIDREVARLAVETLGAKIDQLTDEQSKYLKSWEIGTI